MDDLFQRTINLTEVGIIIVDTQLRVITWNTYVARISGIKGKEAVGRKLPELCYTFGLPRYRDMLRDVISSNQCRFCSSKLHKAFVYPKNAFDEGMRQNMIVMPMSVHNETYVLIQIIDITYQVSSEHKLTSLLSEMTRGYNDIKESEEYNRRLAETDVLTGLHNRFALSQRIKDILEDRMIRDEYALLFLDLDGFKKINDSFGHSAGDKLLVKVGEKLRYSVRSEDMVVRYGGDEFVVLIHAKGREGAEIVAKKLVSEVAKPTLIDGRAIRITVSIGIVLFGKETDAECMINKADSAMYQSKRDGKNRLTFYSDQVPAFIKNVSEDSITR